MIIITHFTAASFFQPICPATFQTMIWNKINPRCDSMLTDMAVRLNESHYLPLR